MQSTLAKTVLGGGNGDRASLIVVGTSFKNSRIAYRERLADTLDRQDWVEGTGAKEWVTLKTCSRIEFIISSRRPLSVVTSLLGRAESEVGEARFYVKEGREAITHVFSVASGLDSIVPYEDQVIEQLRKAGNEARRAGTSSGVLPPFLDAAVSTGKRIRYAARGTGGSLGEFGLDAALQELGHAPRSVLLIGTGKMARIAATKLRPARVRVASRRKGGLSSLPKASQVSWDDIVDVASESDLIVSATKCDGYALEKEDLPDDRRRVILDLSFPRTVDPLFRRNDNVRLLDLDDLADRSSSMPRASEDDVTSLLEYEVDRFETWLNTSKIDPTISEIFRWAESLRKEETEEALRKMRSLSPEEKKVVEAMGRSIVNKVLAKPLKFARSADASNKERLEILRAIFAEGQQ
jgi:glutamyl-tRNA reductase